MRKRIIGLIILSISITALPVAANPVPETAFLFHVSPAYDPVVSCEDLVQYTDATGILDFYLVAYSDFFNMGTDIAGAGAHVDWPASWVLYEVELYGDETSSYTVSGNSATITVMNASPPWGAGSLAPVARFRFDANSFGTVSLDEPTETWIATYDYVYGPLWGTGQAGVECAYCYQKCSLSFTMQPVPETEIIITELEQDQTESHLVDVQIHGLGPDFLDVETTVPWLTASAEQTDYWHYVVTIDVDATDLELGWHEGYVSMATECVGCTKVRLLVLDPVSVQAASWGSVKALFR